MTDTLPTHISSEVALTTALHRNAPIGVMDSGVGGFSILREMQALFPHEDILFIGDQANVPYGSRSLNEVQSFVEGIVRFFIAGHAEIDDLFLRQVKLIVIACNTASAASLHSLRHKFPQIKFVGLEPAVKPAAENSNRQKIGVLATSATFQGRLYASVVDRYAQNIDIFTRACPEFVTLVERGGEFTEADQTFVCDSLAPLLTNEIDQLVLGCTHFPFLKPLMQKCVGEQVEIVDPSPAVARQVGRVLEKADAFTSRTSPGRTIYATTGPLAKFSQQAYEMLNIENPILRELHWQAGVLQSTVNK